MILEELRREVLDTANMLPKYGLVWMAGGTVCARDPQTGHIVVTPSGIPYENLEPQDMVVTTLEMTVVEGNLRPSVALNLWCDMFRQRPDIMGLVHTHSPHATAFSVAVRPIPVITETMADWFGQPVPVTPYLSVEDPLFVTLPAQTMGSGFGVLLGQHGVITVGKTLQSALERAVTLEEAARTYFIARTIGTPHTLTKAQAKASFDYYNNRYGQPGRNSGPEAPLADLQ